MADRTLAVAVSSAGVRSKRGAAGLLLAALLAKATVLAQLHAHPLLQPEGGLDSDVYVRLARQAAGGDWLLGHEAYFVSPFYVYFLAAVFVLTGSSLLAAKTVQIVLGTAAVGLVLATTDAWYGRRAAWIAGALAAATGVFTFNEVLLLQSAVDPFLTALALYLLARALGASGHEPAQRPGLGGGGRPPPRPRPTLADERAARGGPWRRPRPRPRAGRAPQPRGGRRMDPRLLPRRAEFLRRQQLRGRRDLPQRAGHRPRHRRPGP
ncbi:MAG: hypothetical protein DMF80_01005 [Acidobacteria bacterium]|nr:MAG: hypothetical protein DMF80_01005 [Acidobacteriota bacterium]